MPCRGRPQAGSAGLGSQVTPRKLGHCVGLRDAPERDLELGHLYQLSFGLWCRATPRRALWASSMTSQAEQQTALWQMEHAF